jgi:hypothetical protein
MSYHREVARQYLDGLVRYTTCDLDLLESLLKTAEATAIMRAAAKADTTADDYNMPVPGESLSDKTVRGIQARAARALAFTIRSLVSKQ